MDKSVEARVKKLESNLDDVGRLLKSIEELKTSLEDMDGFMARLAGRLEAQRVGLAALLRARRNDEARVREALSTAIFRRARSVENADDLGMLRDPASKEEFRQEVDRLRAVILGRQPEDLWPDAEDQA